MEAFWMWIPCGSPPPGGKEALEQNTANVNVALGAEALFRSFCLGSSLLADLFLLHFVLCFLMDQSLFVY